MHQPRFLARGLLVSFLLIALLAAPGALTFTWAGAAAGQQAGTNTPTATDAATQTAVATSTAASVGKFARLQAAPLAACSGTTVTQWTFDGNSITPITGTGSLVVPIDVATPVTPYPSGTPDPSIGFLNWPAGTSPDSDRYLEIDGISTQGRESISLSFAFNSETGGPTKVDVYYSTTSVASYNYFSSVALAPPDTWPASPALINFNTVTQLDDNANVRFKLYAYGATDPSKMLSLDNITISGNCLPPTPTPTATDTATPTNTPTSTATLPPGCALTPTPGPYPERSVLINEVGWGGTVYTSSDVWLELYNPGACPINLSNWSLSGTRNGGGTEFTVGFSASDVIANGGYLLIVRNDGTIPDRPSKIDSHLSLLTTGEILYLYGPSSPHEVVDTANLYGSTSSTVGSVGPWPAGLSVGRASMERYRSITDAPDAWVTYAGPIDPNPSAPHDRNSTNRVRGTPGGANWATTVTITPSPLPTKYRRPTPIPPTPFAHMLINEFLPRAGTDWNHDGAVNVYDEFIELKNLGPISVNLSNWKLDGDPSLGSTPFTLPSVTLKTGERMVFYGSTTHINLRDSGDTVRLINPSGVVFDARSYGPVGKPDVSHCRIPDGFYWQDACFPTPGNANSLTGSAAAPPLIAAVAPPPCLLPDTAPEAFRLGECAPYGGDLWDRTYWDDQAGNSAFPVQDVYSKWKTIVR
jgi:hypothetical protein